MTSVISRTSSTGAEDHDHEEESPKILYNMEEDTTPSVSVLEILKKNKPEWLFIVVACIGSVVVGCSMPLFAVLFGDIMEVSKISCLTLCLFVY